MILHPLTLISIVIWVSSIALLSANLVALTGLMMVSALLCLFNGRIPLKSLFRLLPVLLIVFILQILFRRGGSMIWSYGWFRITSEGLVMGAQVVFRLSIIYLSAGLLIKLQFNDFRNAFALIRLPEELSFMVCFVIHFIPLLTHRFKDTVILLRYRGLDIRHGSWMRKIKIYRIIALSVLTGLLHNVHYQAIALELRGFRSPGHKTARYRTDLVLLDWLVITLLILLGGLVGYLSR
ncbi:MAG: energy-coupling factor transporter transmembrane protein EcfT [Candidatus Cloacimonetes bacterium]|nr:energy-coupling factor transporter transmembrane protein EcfT [Candidatus Cloacimonadota bacterium]